MLEHNSGGQVAQEVDKGIGKILMGSKLLALPDSRLLGYGFQISQALTSHQVTMLQYTPEQLVEIMREERAVVIIDPMDQGRCWAFAQISPWTETDGNGGNIVKAVEFRSWKSWQSKQGAVALQGAVRLSAIRYPGIPLYAVVEANNTKAREILLESGAEIVSMPSSMRVELKAGEKKAEVVTLDLSGIKT